MSASPAGNLLFVYGTLRRDAPRSMFHLFAGDATFVGHGRVRGRLLDLGAYPGLVPCEDEAARVPGEVYALGAPAVTLPRLDAYEGCGPDDSEPHAFERVERDAVLATGEVVRVFVYVYRGQ